MASHFLINAKMGLIGLDSPKPRVSNKGGISEIRSRMGGAIQGGFPKLTLLGSQNAIPGSSMELELEHEKKMNEDLAKKIAEDIAKVLPTPSTPTPAPTPSTPILPGQTKKKIPLLGGSGGKQSEESKEQAEERKKSEEAVEPRHEPPYYLPSEQSLLQERVKFLQDRYGKKESLKDVDAITKDSRDFSEAVEKAKSIGYAVNEWKRKDAGNQDLMNRMKSVASWVLDKVTELAKRAIPSSSSVSGIIAGELSKEALDQLKKVIQSSALTQESFQNEMTAIQNALFSARPAWKAKWESILSAEKKRVKKEFMEQFIKSMSEGGDLDTLPVKKKKKDENIVGGVEI